MRQWTSDFAVATQGQGLYDCTRELARFAKQTGAHTGLLTAFIRHTSASLVIQENADPDVQRDLQAWMERLAREGEPYYRHTIEGPDDMPAHLRSAVTASSLQIPLLEGRLALGTWQGVYVWEHRRAPHQRHIALHLLGE